MIYTKYQNSSAYFHLLYASFFIWVLLGTLSSTHVSCNFCMRPFHMDHSSDCQGNPWKSTSFPGCPSFPSPFLLCPSLWDDAPLIVFQEGSWTVWSVEAQGWTLLFALLASLMTVNLTSCNHCTHGCQRSNKTVFLSSSS